MNSKIFLFPRTKSMMFFWLCICSQRPKSTINSQWLLEISHFIIVFLWMFCDMIYLGDLKCLPESHKPQGETEFKFSCVWLSFSKLDVCAEGKRETDRQRSLHEACIYESMRIVQNIQSDLIKTFDNHMTQKNEQLKHSAWFILLPTNVVQLCGCICFTK